MRGTVTLVGRSAFVTLWRIERDVGDAMSVGKVCPFNSAAMHVWVSNTNIN